MIKKSKKHCPRVKNANLKHPRYKRTINPAIDEEFNIKVCDLTGKLIEEISTIKIKK